MFFMSQSDDFTEFAELEKLELRYSDFDDLLLQIGKRRESVY